MSDQPAPNRGATITPNRLGGHNITVNGRDISDEIDDQWTIRVEGNIRYLDVSYVFHPHEPIRLEGHAERTERESGL